MKRSSALYGFLILSCIVSLFCAAETSRAEEKKTFPPTRVITKGPKHHWFGYYDKLQFDPTDRYVLSMQVDFEHRSPQPDDVIKVGMIDLQDNDRWIELGESRAWNWQQGCMLQWLPGSDSEIIWNDREGDRFVCHIMDVFTKKKRTIPHAIYDVNPDGKSAVSTDFHRIQDIRPGYGYAGSKDPYADDLAPAQGGLYRVDLQTGESRLIISLKQLSELGVIINPDPKVKHHAYHLLHNPSGTRFIALHRWQYPDTGRHLTRMITANTDGTDIRVVIPNGYASHFIWRDDEHILSQSRDWLGEERWGNFLFEDKEGGGNVVQIGKDVLDSGGHLSYLKDQNWLLNDTYPKTAKRFQTPHLFHIPTSKRIDLGDFHLPKEYTGEWRVDTHPRLSRNEKWVCIDSPHKDQGRQLHLIDITGLTKP